MKQHPTAIVSIRARIDPSVEIGPFAIVEEGVDIGKSVKIYPRAHICSGTSIGRDTEIHMGAVVGHLPQDLSFNGEKTFLKIGKENVIREYVTIHRGTGASSATEIGNGNYLMSHSHVGHDCKIGNNVIIANGALVAGHVIVEDGVFISGNVVFHQFCRVGKLAMVGGFSGVNMDVPPYMVVRGPSRIRSVNLIGLRRAGFTKEKIKKIWDAFKLIYRSGLNTTQAIEKIMQSDPIDEVAYMVNFIKNSKRGICSYKYVAEYDEEDEENDKEKKEVSHG